MKINRRLKILREKHGYSQEAFTQILFEDFDIQEQKKYQKAYPQIEAGIQAVDLTLVEQVLIKFRPYPFWLINGEKQMDSEMSKLIEKFAIHQANDSTRDNKIIITGDNEAINKLLAEKDGQIEKLQNIILFMTDTLFTSSKANQQTSPPPPPPKKPEFKLTAFHKVAASLVLLFAVGILFFINQPSPLPSSTNPHHPRHISFEEKITSYFQHTSSLLELERYPSYVSFRLLQESAEWKLLILDYQEKLLFEKTIQSREKEVVVPNLHWKPGVYYYRFLNPENRLVYMNSIIKN